MCWPMNRSWKLTGTCHNLKNISWNGRVQFVFAYHIYHVLCALLYFKCDGLEILNTNFEWSLFVHASCIHDLLLLCSVGNKISGTLARKQRSLICSIQNSTCSGQFTTRPAQKALPLVNGWVLVSLTALENVTGLILGLRPANERCRGEEKPSLIGWGQTKNQPCVRHHL